MAVDNKLIFSMFLYILDRKKNIQYLFIGLIFFILLAPIAIQAQSPGAGLNTAAGIGYGEIPTETLPEIIGKVVGAALAFIGSIFLILIIYGGFVWMLAKGNETEVEKAKSVLEAAVIGLIIVMAAYAITAFIGNLLTS